MHNYPEISEEFIKLIHIMEKLRAPGGCPWDAKQTLDSLKRYIIEEAYELTEAIYKCDNNDICEEAGDVLLQVIFVATIAKEKGFFDIGDVIEGISEKLVRRHPHVFGDKKIDDAETVLKNWEKIKIQEKKDRQKDESVIAGIPHSLPSIHRTRRVQERASKIGFDWPKGAINAVLDKVDEEIAELKEAINEDSKEHMIEELGDCFFILVNLARHLDIDPENALQEATDKFSARFRIVEKQMLGTGRAPESFTVPELDSMWKFAKKEVTVINGKK